MVASYMVHYMLTQGKLDSPVSTPGDQDTPEVLPGRRKTRGRFSAPAAVARDEPAPKRTRGTTRASRYHDYDDEFEDVRPLPLSL